MQLLDRILEKLVLSHKGLINEKDLKNIFDIAQKIFLFLIVLRLRGILAPSNKCFHAKKISILCTFVMVLSCISGPLGPPPI
jgi:hypothetical protein